MLWNFGSFHTHGRALLCPPCSLRGHLEQVWVDVGESDLVSETRSQKTTEQNKVIAGQGWQGWAGGTPGPLALTPGVV